MPRNRLGGSTAPVLYAIAPHATTGALIPSQSSETQDDQQLTELGYTPRFDRTMSVVENFALGFTYLSPVVGVYAVFAFGMMAAGPPMIWAYMIAGVGQFLVALVFGEVVSTYPIAGGLYPWSRRLVGRKWGWMAGWIYAWALIATIAAVAVGAGPFLASLVGFEPSTLTNTVIALTLLAMATVINLLGTKLLARVAMFGFVCEIAGALVVGAYLLLAERHQPLSVIVEAPVTFSGGSYLAAFLAASLVGLFSCYGFEACADVAEETSNAGEQIPKAMRWTIYVGVGASAFVCLALILATPDISKVMSGEIADPVVLVLTTSFGAIGAKAVIIVVAVSFISCVLSLQAAVSRLLFSYARDGMVVGSSALATLSASSKVPRVALLLTSVLSAAIICLGFFVKEALTIIVSFAVIGIYLAFQMVVAAVLYARSRGWRPSGEFRLGKWGLPIAVAAQLYGLLALVILAWPWTETDEWYLTYMTGLMAASVVTVGLLYMTLLRPHLSSELRQPSP